jgi:hypothetical protein
MNPLDIEEMKQWYWEATDEWIISILEKAKDKAQKANKSVFVMFDYGCAYFEHELENPRDIILRIDP